MTARAGWPAPPTPTPPAPAPSPTPTTPPATYRIDPETGLYYVHARYYSPALGRFLSPDPIGYQGGNNLYAYVGNDPINLVDPIGLNAAERGRIPSLLAFGATVACAIAEPCGLAEAGTAGTVVTLGAGAAALGAIIYNQNHGNQAVTSPEIDPGEVAGKIPQEIDRIARAKGLIPKGPDPMGGRGAYVDPVTGEQRILCHLDGCDGGHLHVNDPTGQRLDQNGRPVPPDSPDAHLPLGAPQ